MYISIFALAVLAYLWMSNSRALGAANRRAADAENRVRDLEQLLREREELQVGGSRRLVIS